MNNVNNNNNKKKKSIRCVVVQFLPDLPNSRKKKQTKNIYIYIKTTIHPRSIKTCEKKGKGYLRACPRDVLENVKRNQNGRCVRTRVRVEHFSNPN